MKTSEQYSIKYDAVQEKMVFEKDSGKLALLQAHARALSKMQLQAQKLEETDSQNVA